MRYFSICYEFHAKTKKPDNERLLSVFDTDFCELATGALHKNYIGQKKVIAGTDTTIIRISSGNPMRQ